MSVLTPAEFRDAIDTGTSDTALQGLIDSAEFDIVAACGPLGTLEDRRRGGTRYVYLSRRAASITTVVERYGDPLGIDDVPMDPTDWTFLPDRQTLRREWVGVHRNDRWADEVIVTYVILDDTVSRKRATINLVKLELAYQPGLTGQQLGAWAEQYRNVNYEDERTQIFNSLMATVALFA